MNERMLVLENGRVFYGNGFGSREPKIAEIVFNTSMVGYQEIMSDPSYFGQMVVMTYPLIGNYGLTDDDYESKGIYMSGFVVREYNDNPSNFRFTKTLGEVMEDNGAAGISGVDTREIVRIIRDEGSMKAMICDTCQDIEKCVQQLKAEKLTKGQVSEVSTQKIWYSRTRNPLYTVVAVDCGIKHNIINCLNKCACNVVVVPYNTPKSEIMKYRPDGLFLSNGPGDPENVNEVIKLIRSMRGIVPMFGICLGHQLIGLAYGAKTYKMKFGHRGGNHPVKNLVTGKVEITSQNHGFCVDPDSLDPAEVEITHINLNDQTCEGLRHRKRPVFSVQYHPEACPGPRESSYLFERFFRMIQETRGLAPS
ncbi:MAG: carbamoyl-phosphate synthase small subunit [Clostridia bacterium]|nr:carbamoyl-phosphate synthase small subunit [Clostridia bacterium]